MLEKLALPQLNDKANMEIYSCKNSYEAIEKLNDARVNKDKQKKKILMLSFETLVGLFDLNYDLKLSFNKEESNSIYLKDITNLSYDEAFYQIYRSCFMLYLQKAHTFKHNHFDKKMYKIAKLALLNNDEEIINKLIDNSYLDLIANSPLESSKYKEEITKDDLTRLNNKEIKRIKTLKNQVFNYNLNGELSLVAIKKVYNCFSSNVFTSLDKEEKIYISNLLLNYYSLEQYDIRDKYRNLIDDNTTNKECLNLIINELFIPGRTMLIMKKNKDLLNDILSGLPYIYENEIDKMVLHDLDDLHNIQLSIGNKRL